MDRSGRLPIIIRLFVICAILAGLALPPEGPAQAGSYTVNSLEDSNDGSCSGDCTLREAMALANGSSVADTITFSVSGTITLTTDLPGVLFAGKPLTIDGAGQSVRISGNNAHRNFYVATAASLTLRNLTVQDGYTTNAGAGVYNQGSLTVENSALDHNRAEDHGGAIYSTGTLTITNSSLTYNSVDIGHGGALYVYTYTHATIAGSTFMGNNTMGNGGAIYSNGYLTIDESDILLNNSAGLDGGGVYNDGYLVMKNTTLGANRTPRDGGAFFNNRHNFTIENCTFAYNSARDGAGAVIYHTDTGSSIRATEFNHNSATRNGGAIFHVSDAFSVYYSDFEHNEAGGNGGAVYNWLDQIYLSDATLDSNSADLDGGAIYNLDNLNISSSTLVGNHALGNGGAIYSDAAGDSPGIRNCTFYGNQADKGGGLYSLTVLNIKNGAFVANRADASGGAVCGDLGVRLFNSIVADSLGSSNCSAPDGSGKPDNYGNNIEDGASCGFGSVVGSMSNTDPLLGPLQNNGGRTETMIPLHGSPAIDGVVWNYPNDSPAEDQRGYERPFAGGYDIGPVEAYYGLFLPLVRK